VAYDPNHCLTEGSTLAKSKGHDMSIPAKNM